MSQNGAKGPLGGGYISVAPTFVMAIIIFIVSYLAVATTTSATLAYSLLCRNPLLVSNWTLSKGY